MIIAIAVTMLTAGTTVCHAQTTQKQQIEQMQDPVYEQDMVEQKAEFVGGMIKHMEFMMRNLKYPKEAEKAGASGTVRVHFIVEKDGRLTHFEVIHSPDEKLSEEALRLMELMPRWTPAKNKGKVVRCLFTIPVPFGIKDSPQDSPSGGD